MSQVICTKPLMAEPCQAWCSHGEYKEGHPGYKITGFGNYIFWVSEEDFPKMFVNYDGHVQE